MVMYKVQVPREVKVAEACTQVEIFPDVPDKKEVEVFMKISLWLVEPKSQENNWIVI